jgi:hypothetical protein
MECDWSSDVCSSDLDATASPNRIDRTAGTNRLIRTLDGSAPVELRAVKITNVDSQVMFSDAALAEAIDYLAEIGINAILPVVQNAGYTQYRSAVMDYYFNIPLDPRLGGRDPLAVIVREARRVGIEVYPWFEYGFASHYSGPNPATGGFIGQRYPHWMSRDAAGNICKKTKTSSVITCATTTISNPPWYPIVPRDPAGWAPCSRLQTGAPTPTGPNFPEAHPSETGSRVRPPPRSKAYIAPPTSRFR